LKELKNGKVALYDDLGQSIVLTREGIVVKGAGRPVTITDTPSVTLDMPNSYMKGNLKVDGNISNDGNVATGGNVVAQGDISDHGTKSMKGMRDTYNLHKNPTPPGTPDRLM
jgi:phage gp45-like